MPTLTSPRLGRVVLAGLLSLTATGAFATANSDLYVAGRPPIDARSVSISTRGLDLTNAKDRNTLAMRINYAAEAVCDIYSGSKLDKMPDARACFADAKGRALAQLDASGLNATAAFAGGGMR